MVQCNLENIICVHFFVVPMQTKIYVKVLILFRFCSCVDATVYVAVDK